MPKHSLLRLASKIHNTPHLITPEAFSVALDYLDARNSGVKMMMPMNDEHEDTDENDNLSGLVCISIDGSLTYKPLVTICGEVGTSYVSLVDQVEDAIEDGATTIVLDVSSGGGEASHVFQAARDIREMCDASNVKLLAYADTMACSAAYALSVVADMVVVNPSATIGSIGCVVCLMDTSKAMEQAGLKRIFVTSGEDKVPYAEDGTFKKDFLEEIQKEVDALNVEFSEFVSEFTGISADTIRGFQARTFNAQEAVEAGLATSVMTNKEFATFVADIHQRGTYD